MDILITGGAGYIGSIVIEKILKQSIDINNIIVIDDLSTGNLESIPSSCTFIKSDFGNMELLKNIFSKYRINTVIHLAATADVPDSVRNPEIYYMNNISNTLSLITMMKEFHVNKIIFSSTAATYGEPEKVPINESNSLNPINPYGFTKQVCENMIKDFSFSYGLKYIIFRYFCAAGATKNNGERRKNETHLIPRIINNILGKNSDFKVFGNLFPTRDGSGVRDYVHVEDIADAHIIALRKIDKMPNKIFNIGSNRGYSVFEMIHFAEEIFDKKILYDVQPPREGDPASLVASNDRIYNDWSWKPSRSIEDILISVYNWELNSKY